MIANIVEMHLSFKLQIHKRPEGLFLIVFSDTEDNEEEELRKGSLGFLTVQWEDFMAWLPFFTNHKLLQLGGALGGHTWWPVTATMVHVLRDRGKERPTYWYIVHTYDPCKCIRHTENWCMSGGGGGQDEGGTEQCGELLYDGKKALNIESAAKVRLLIA